MENFLLWILASMLIFFLLSRLNIYIHLCYSRSGSNDQIDVKVTMLNNLVVYHFNVPLIEVTKTPLPWLRSVLEAPDGRMETHIDRERRFAARFLEIYAKHPDKLRRFLKVSRRFFEQYRLVVNNLLSKLICENFHWRTVFGSEQADVAGLMTGAFWSLKGLFLSAFRKRCAMVSPPQVRVVPVFGENKFETELRCILRIRLGNVINAVFSLVKSIHKGGDGQ